MHEANHPTTKHYCEDIWAVDPRVAVGSKKVAILWASPDCTDHSRAKGAQPRSSGRRALADVVIRWAREVRPTRIFLENVEEWAEWGPLKEGKRDPEHKGELFRAWLAELMGLGYAVEWRSLVAADYGTPTTRRRLFLVARCDGLPIVWPAATHGKGRAESWRPASEVIDWALPCPSIFDRKKPLAEATLNRIASGVRRYVLKSASPFLLPLTHQGGPDRVHSIDDPMKTITCAHRGEIALASPFLVRHGHYSTITGAGLVEGKGAGTFRGQQLKNPLATVCATNDKQLVMPFLAKHYGGVVGHSVEKTLGTVTTIDHHALSAAFLTKLYGTATHGAPVTAPMPTVTASGNHLAATQAFLLKYYGAGGREHSAQQLLQPLGTVTTRDRFGLVMVHGEPYQIVDIGMRMLQPRELFNAQGFPSDYIIDPSFNGKPLTKTAATTLAGNSVCRQVAAAIVRANTCTDARAA